MSYSKFERAMRMLNSVGWGLSEEGYTCKKITPEILVKHGFDKDIHLLTQYSEYQYFLSFTHRRGYGLSFRRDHILIIDRSIPITSLENEIWEEYYGYKISNMGRIVNKVGDLHKIHLINGRRAFNPHISGKRKCLLVARVVASIFVPNPENKPEVNHINGIANDDRAVNLEWVTRHENVKHAIDNKLFYSFNPNRVKHRRVTPNMVEKIRRLYSQGGWSYPKLADKFKVSKNVVGKIIRKDTWKNI